MAAVTPMMPDGKKLSFAKVVAASGTRDNLAGRVAIPTPATRPPQEHIVPRPVIPLAPVPAAIAAKRSIRPAPATPPPTSQPRAHALQTPKMPKQQPLDAVEREVDVGMKILALEQKTPNLVVNGTSPTAIDRIGKGILPHKDVPGSSEEKTDSNSDLGTKPPSLDGKSIASGTTFALDEKESLRPDDSASMKAAAEDDDAFSTRGSILAGSRMGSDNRVVRIQIGEMPPLNARHIAIVPESTGDESLAQAGPSSQPAQVEPKILLGAPEGTPDAINNALYGQNPDEKLLEAMNSPKDRLFLLRLEKDVIEFVQNSKEPFIDLPPCNSFCRLLTHKLADYYHMTHSYESSTSGAGSVRIFRTPFCRVPPSLASIAAAANPTSSTPPPAILPKKIMRRGEEGSTAPPSGDASKATSEVGSDSKDKPSFKERLTREEREEAYNRARERIFGTSEKTGESTPENDNSNAVSRASSVSAKNKSSMGKRKLNKRGDDNEGFETRSQYAAFYGHPHQPWQPQYVPINMNPQFNSQMQQPQQQQQQQQQPAFVSQMGPGYMPNQGQFSGVSAGVGFQYNNMSTYTMPQPIQSAPYGQPMNRPAPMPTYPQPTMPAAPMPTTPQQTWQQPYTAGSSTGYQQQRSPVPPAGGPGTSPPGIPYAYGQLPVNVNPNDPKSQHPIPGSYSRQHAFNPKTQSFIPGATSMMPMASQGYSPGPMHGSPQIATAPLYGSYGQQQYGSGFGMARQASGSGMPPVYPVTGGPPHMGHHLPHIPSKPPIPQGPAASGGGGGGGGGNPSTNFPHLPNYGNPATLPQKPPNPQSLGV